MLGRLFFLLHTTVSFPPFRLAPFMARHPLPPIRPASFHSAAEFGCRLRLLVPTPKAQRTSLTSQAQRH